LPLPKQYFNNIVKLIKGGKWAKKKKYIILI
jgi:hypothetical protein